MGTQRIVVLVVAACGSEDHDSSRRLDASLFDAATAVDAISDSSLDAQGCTAATSYTNVPIAGTEMAGADTGMISWTGRLDTSSMPDALQVVLYDGTGPFEMGITPQTIQLTGDETSYATCAACVVIGTDLHPQLTDYYMATGGTLDLTSVSGTFQGTLTNLTLQHVVISGNMLVPANDGCTSSIPSLTMNATIQ